MPTNENAVTRENQRRLNEALSRLNYRAEGVGVALEEGIHLVRCARAAAISDNADPDAGGAIADVLLIAEDYLEIAYMRYLLS